MVSAGAVLGLALGYAGALALSAVFETETAIALPVAVTLQEIGLGSSSGSGWCSP